MRSRGYDVLSLDDLLVSSERVVTHSTLRELGMSTSTITRRIAVRGPWQRLLPGVVLAHRGRPRRREMLLGALAFAQDDAVITGTDALQGLGANVSSSPRIHVLTPQERHRSSFGFVRIERTRRLPDPIMRRGLPFAPVPRAAIDACRHLERLDEVRNVAAAVVQQKLCTPDDLVDEVRQAARQRTALSRRVLEEISDGVRSVAEAKAREVLAKAGVPAPLWNVTLLIDGVPFMSPDAFWPDRCIAMEIDSIRWHLDPKNWKRTQTRAQDLAMRTVPLISFSPGAIMEDPQDFARRTWTFVDVHPLREMPAGLSYQLP